MENPEHNIKEAFNESDAKTRLPQKDAMWNRLDRTMHGQKGVAAFWRVAAIFLGLLMVAGVFAGMSYRSRQQKETEKFLAKNAQLQQTIDSLLVRPAEIKTETKVVEKVVYRERSVRQNENDNNSILQEKYLQLQDSTEILLVNREKQYQNKMQQLETELTLAKTELTSYKQDNEKQGQQKKDDPFQLKSERVELGVQKTSLNKNPELELKVFPKNFIQNTNDLNKSIFKK